MNRLIDPIQKLETSFSDSKELLEISSDEAEIISEISQDLVAGEEVLRALELRRMLSDEMDSQPAIVSINAGSGGTEAQDWAQIIQRMLMRYAQRRGYQVELVDEQAGEAAGIKSCSFVCRGDHPYGYLKSERGVHRLVRISPFDAGKRRHTSFAAVDVVPEIDDQIEIEVRQEDLRVDTYRASGAGGQHVNRTDSAIRLTHLPSGIVVACQTNRSQHQNRDTAMRMLRSKLYEREMQKRQEAVDAKNAEKREISWGSQIRSYVLHPYRMVKDHRTNRETGQVDAVLDGDLEDFTEAFLLHQSETKAT